MMENNNKESFNLLGMSGSNTESGSEIREFVHPPKKKKMKRRARGVHSRNLSDDESQRGGNSRTCIACRIGRAVSTWLAIALLLLWLIMLTSLGFRLHSQLSRLSSDVDQVVAGSKGVPDALQKCHSMSKELQHNQTLLLAQLMTLSSQVTNFSLQVKDVHHGLSEVEYHLKRAPELVRVPQELGELTGSVGQLGSRLGGLDASVASLKTSNTLLLNETDTLRQEVTNLKETVLQLSNASANAGSANMEGGGTADTRNEKDLDKLLGSITRDLSELKFNISHLNETLIQRLILDEKTFSSGQGISIMLSNVTARISALESSCSSIKDYSNLSNAVDHISSQVNETLDQVQSQINELFGKIKKQEMPLSRNISADSGPISLSTQNSDVLESLPTNGSMASDKYAGSSSGKAENVTIALQAPLTTKSTDEENTPKGFSRQVTKSAEET